ncbi:hypothetical protein ACTMU2_10300 [Cupriavidus basilensis]
MHTASLAMWSTSGTDGAPRKAKVQCDVIRAPGDKFVVTKVRLPE